MLYRPNCFGAKIQISELSSKSKIIFRLSLILRILPLFTLFFTDDNSGRFDLSLLSFWSLWSFLAFFGSWPQPFTGMPNLWSHLLPRYWHLSNVSYDFCWRCATLEIIFIWMQIFFFSTESRSAKVSLRFFTALLLKQSWKHFWWRLMLSFWAERMLSLFQRPLKSNAYYHVLQKERVTL